MEAGGSMSLSTWKEKRLLLRAAFLSVRTPGREAAAMLWNTLILGLPSCVTPWLIRVRNRHGR